MSLRNARIVSVLGFVVLLTFSPVALGQGVESSTPRGLDVVLLLDSSESTRTTDPKDHRLTAAHFLLDYLEATSELLRVNHRAAVANFGGKVGAGAAPLRLVGQGRVHDAIRKKLIRDTDFRPALEFALREIRGGSTETERQTIVVLFTDGLPALNSDTLEGETLANYFEGEPIPNDPLGTKLDDLVEELHDLGGELFVVAVGQNPEAAEGWRSLLPDNHYLELEETSELASAYHQIFSRRLGFEGIKQYELKAGQPVSIDFEPLVEHATLTFLKANPEAKLTLEPSGEQAPRRVAGGGPEELHDVYQLPSPNETDRWSVRVDRGDARLLVAERRPTLVIREPFSPQPAGSPLSLQVSLGGAVSVDQATGLRLIAKIVGPEFDGPVDSELSFLEDGWYRLLTPTVNVRGVYSINLEAQLKSKGVTLTQQVQIQVETVPEITNLTIYSPGSNKETFTIQAQVHNADQLDPRSSPKLEIYTAAGLLAVSSSRKRKGVYTGTVSSDQQPITRIKASISGITPAGIPYSSTRVSSASLSSASPSDVFDLLPLLCVAVFLLMMLFLAWRYLESFSPLRGILGPQKSKRITSDLIENIALSLRTLPASINFFKLGLLRKDMRWLWARINETLGLAPKDQNKLLMAQLASRDAILQADAIKQLANTISDGSAEGVELLYRAARFGLPGYFEIIDAGSLNNINNPGMELLKFWRECHEFWDNSTTGSSKVAVRLAGKGADVCEFLRRSLTNTNKDHPRLTSLRSLYKDLERLANLDYHNVNAVDDLAHKIPADLTTLVQLPRRDIEGECFCESIFSLQAILQMIVCDRKSFLMDIGTYLEEIEERSLAYWQGKFTPEKTILVMILRCWQEVLAGLIDAEQPIEVCPLTPFIPVMEDRVTEVRFAVGTPVLHSLPAIGSVEVQGPTGGFAPDGNSARSWPVKEKLRRSTASILLSAVRISHNGAPQNGTAEFELSVAGIDECQCCKIKLASGSASARECEPVPISCWRSRSEEEIVERRKGAIVISVEDHQLAQERLNAMSIVESLRSRGLPENAIEVWRGEGLDVKDIFQFRKKVFIVSALSVDHAMALRYSIDTKLCGTGTRPLVWEAHVAGYLRDSLAQLIGDAEAIEEVEEYIRIIDGERATHYIGSLLACIKADGHWYVTSDLASEALDDTWQVQLYAREALKALDAETGAVVRSVYIATRTIEDDLDDTLPSGGDQVVAKGELKTPPSVEIGRIAAVSSDFHHGDVGRLTSALQRLSRETDIIDRYDSLHYRIANRVYYQQAGRLYGEESLSCER